MTTWTGTGDRIGSGSSGTWTETRWWQSLTALAAKGGAAGYLLLGSGLLNVLVARQRELSQSAAVDRSALITLAYVGLCFVYCLWYRYARGPVSFYALFRPPCVFVTAYVLACFASVLWSSLPLYSAYRAFECLTYLLLLGLVCLNLCRNGSDQDMVDWLVLWAFWTWCCGVAFFVKLLGVQVVATEHMLRVGDLSIGPVFFVALYLSRRRILSCLLMIITFLTLANTLYVGIFLGLIPALIMGDERARKLLFFVVGCILLVALGLGVERGLESTVLYGQGGVGWDHMTGRGAIWTRAIEYGMDRLLTGYGFVSGESDMLAREGFVAVISTHNVLISAFLAVGLTGPLLLLAFFVNLFAKAVTTPMSPAWRSGWVGTVIMAFAVSMASPGLGGRVYGSWISVMFVCVLLGTLSHGQGLRSLWNEAMPDGESPIERVPSRDRWSGGPWQ